MSSGSWTFEGQAGVTDGPGGEVITSKKTSTCVEPIVADLAHSGPRLCRRWRRRICRDPGEVSEPYLLAVTRVPLRIDLVHLPEEDLWALLTGRRPPPEASATRLFMTVGPDGSDVAIGRATDGRRWVYSVSSGRVSGELSGPACVLPSPLEDPSPGERRYVVAGLTDDDDPTTMVIVLSGTHRARCRVHENMWVTWPLRFEINARPLVRWETRGGVLLREFRMAPLVVAMLETGARTYAPSR